MDVIQAIGGSVDVTRAFEDLAISVGLGLFVGLQRERAKPGIAGIRTFALITMSGTMCAMLSQSVGGWILAAGLLGVVAFSVMGSSIASRAGPGGAGITSEIAIILMFMTGAYIVLGAREVAVAVGAGTAVLLNLKPMLHGFVKRLGDQDVWAIMQFALMSFIILPVVPDKAFGPYTVLNLHQIWLMVVLVVGISLGGYIAYKFLGQRAGLLVGGLLGGLISSTATTASYSRRAMEACHEAAAVVVPGDGAAGVLVGDPVVAGHNGNSAGAAAAAGVVIAIASCILYVRVLAEIAVVAPSLTPAAAGPMVAMLVVSMALAVIMWSQSRHRMEGLPEQQNPTELKPALAFGLIYAVVLIAVAAAQEAFGQRGLYVVAGLSGLTNMDAITLSAAKMVREDGLNTGTAWRAIMIAAMANTAFKAAMVVSMGGRQLIMRMMPVFGLTIVAGIVILALWRS
jgi:uncharacterized membrane protein (DUF4010 family)